MAVAQLDELSRREPDTDAQVPGGSSRLGPAPLYPQLCPRRNGPPPGQSAPISARGCAER